MLFVRGLRWGNPIELCKNKLLPKVPYFVCQCCLKTLLLLENDVQSGELTPHYQTIRLAAVFIFFMS